MRRVLVTGGTGYIGSHTVVELIKAGYEVIIVDNLSNSSISVLDRLEKITGVRPLFYKLNVEDEVKLEEVFKNEHIDDVIHFAGLKAVGESVEKPKLYHDVNVGSSIALIKMMKKYGVKNIVFSSSATVYGIPKHVPMSEEDEVTVATNPYGQTKIDIERLLMKEYAEDKSFNIAILRYFNPIGAHKSGLLGEDPNGIPNNLMPYISQVAIKKLPYVRVFGNDYPTVDGTGVRDYIHVLDLATGHTAALKKLHSNSGLVIYNLGTGKGTSVLELIHAFEKANDLKIPYQILERRPGDIAECYASADKAKRELGWVAEHDVVEACRDSYNFQTNNPEGIK